MTSLECLASPSDRASPPARSASILFGQAATWQQRIRRTLKCVQQVDVQLAIGPADARSCGESKGDLSSVSPAMAFGSIGRREESAACTHGQALLLQLGSPSLHACGRSLPTAHRPIGARVIAELLSRPAEVVDAHNVLSVSHWDRIGRGLPYAAPSAVPWAILHARTFDQDVLLCGRCGGGLRVRAVIVDPEVAVEILKSPSRHAGERGAVARGPPSQLVAAWWAELGTLWGKNAGGQVRPGCSDVMGIGRVDGVALMG